MEEPINPPNFKRTNDPNVVIGKHGAKITKQEFENANKNGYAWKDFDAYADYVGGWARPVKDQIPIQPYYRAYAQKEPINGADVAVLVAKNNPDINKMLTRNIAPKGEVPMFGSDDADIIRKLIATEKMVAQSSNYPDAKLYDAMVAAKKQK